MLGRVFLDLIHIAVGLAILLAGAWLTVRSATRLASSFGISPIIIGATVVAFGTSAPEFVVSLLAATRESSGLAIGNVLGSNVANVALVLGASALVRPMTVHRRLLRWEIPVLAAATLAMLLLAANGRLGHIEGAVMFLGLAAFIVVSPRLWPETAATAGADAAEASRALEQDGTARVLDGGLLLLGLAGLTLGADTAVRGAVNVRSKPASARRPSARRSWRRAPACRRWRPASSRRFAGSTRSRWRMSWAPTSSTCSA